MSVATVLLLYEGKLGNFTVTICEVNFVRKVQISYKDASRSRLLLAVREVESNLGKAMHNPALNNVSNAQSMKFIPLYLTTNAI